MQMILVMRSAPSLPLLQGRLLLRMVGYDRVLSMVQIELWDISTEYKQITRAKLNWLKTVLLFNCVQTNDCLIELLVILRNSWNYLCTNEWVMLN